MADNLVGSSRQLFPELARTDALAQMPAEAPIKAGMFRNILASLTSSMTDYAENAFNDGQTSEEGVLRLDGSRAMEGDLDMGDTNSIKMYDGAYIGLTTGTTPSIYFDDTNDQVVAYGRLYVGPTTTAPTGMSTSARNLIVGHGGSDSGMTIYSGTGSIGRINFADGTAGADFLRGYLYYSHTDNGFILGTDGTSRFNLGSDGNFRLYNASNCSISIAAASTPSNAGDTFTMYSTDFVPGNACPHFITEDGTVIGLNQSLFTTDSPTFESPTCQALYLATDSYGSDVTSGGTAIVSSGLYPERIFDNNLATKWSCTGSTGWCGYNFGVGNDKTIQKYTVSIYSAIGDTLKPKTWTFQGSATGAWGGEEVTLDTQTDVAWTSATTETLTYTFVNATAYRYYRMNITANWGHGSAVQVSEMEMMEAAVGGLFINDTDASHYLQFLPGSDLSADRTLTLTTGDADRTITLQGNPTLNDWFDQAVKAASNVNFGTLGCDSITIATTEALAFTDGGSVNKIATTVADPGVDTSLVTEQGIREAIDAIPGGGDVTAAANLTDNNLIRGDGGAKGVQLTGITVADTTNNMSGIGTIGCGAITSTGASTFNSGSVDADFTVNWNTGTGLFVQGSDGFVGVGMATPLYRLDVLESLSASPYAVANFHNAGNNVNAVGINIRCGADHDTADAYLLQFQDTDGDLIGYIQWDQSTGILDFTGFSDKRLKTNIVDTEMPALEKLKQLRVVDYSPKDNADVRWTSLVADEAELIMPEIVSDLPNGYKGFQRGALIIPLLKAVQELESRIAVLEKI